LKRHRLISPVIKPRHDKTAILAALSLAVITLLVSCGGGSANTGGSGGLVAPGCTSEPECQTLVFGGLTRSYLLHVPSNFVPGSSALVIGLHGSRGSGAMFRDTSQLSVKADQQGFAVAYPYSVVSPGSGITEWNEFFNNTFGSNAPDDVGFLRQLIVTLQSNIDPNPKRIYATGLSNGGFMAHRVGVQLSDLIAAIAVVEGTVVSPGQVQNVPLPLAPVSVLMLHGDQDPTVLYCGGPAVASQEETFNYWAGASANHCATFDTPAALCDAQRNITSVVEKDGTACDANTEVRFYRLEGGVHLWYNVPMNVSGQVPFNPSFNSTIGVTTDDILWNFFNAHPKP
jgi:polyhydroxybutyrate depolymerase